MDEEKNVAKIARFRTGDGTVMYGLLTGDHTLQVMKGTCSVPGAPSPRRFPWIKSVCSRRSIRPTSSPSASTIRPRRREQHGPAAAPGGL